MGGDEISSETARPVHRIYASLSMSAPLFSNWVESSSVMIRRSVLTLVANLIVLVAVLFLVGGCLAWLNTASVVLLSLVLVSAVLALLISQNLLYDVPLEEVPSKLEKTTDFLPHRQLECCKKFSGGFNKLLESHLPKDLCAFFFEECLSFLEMREFLLKIQDEQISRFLFSGKPFYLKSEEEIVNGEGLIDFVNRVKRLFSPSLQEKVLRFWTSPSRVPAAQCEDVGALLDRLENLAKSNCPLFWLSKFLNECHKSNWLGLSFEGVFLGIDTSSLEKSSTYCVSRLGLLESKSTIFSRKWWVLSQIIPREKYEQMVKSYGYGLKGEFLEIVRKYQMLFRLFVKENNIGLVDAPKIEEFKALCEHRYSPEAFYCLSELSLERLDWFARLTNYNGENVLAKWMMAFGEYLYDRTSRGFNEYYRPHEYRFFASSVMCLTEEELEDGVGNEKEFSHKLSTLSGLFIDISDITDSWYTGNKALLPE
ncbi:DUF1389 domain-containing protein [Chlamydiifrater phoenicopteri]|uniref:DUF1389 domain-containing protein n=1 Tax=Chlamydiifrater phoenicopteri TaxID=2681469 RepID=UPI001BCB63DA|nr:DUF1389 domain-containing protein [Chlamydiifrater phoenicopteri]